jgi:nucleotide-binding universal stress UspA family protein
VLEDLAASADLLVIGRGHQSRVGLGGRAGHLIHNTVTPTAVVPASDFGSVEQVVVGVDGSEMSVRAAVWAHDQADVLGVPLKAVYAWTDPYDEMRWWGEEDRQTRDALVAAADRTLTSVAGALHRERPASSVDMSTMWVEHEPVVGLLDIARDGSVLVVGSHGYGGVGRLVLGSVALSLVTHATVPIVVVRPEAVV